MVDITLDSGLGISKLCGYIDIVLLDGGLHLVKASLHGSNIVAQTHIGSLIGYELRIGDLCISEKLLDSCLDGLQVDGAVLVELHGLILSLQLCLLLVDIALDSGLSINKLCGYIGVVLLDSGLHLVKASLHGGNIVAQTHIGGLIGYELRIGSLRIGEELLDSSLDGLQVDGAVLVELHGLILSLQLCLLLVDIGLDSGLGISKLCGYIGIVLLDGGLHLVKTSLHGGNLLCQTHISSLVGQFLQMLCLGGSSILQIFGDGLIDTLHGLGVQRRSLRERTVGVLGIKV